MRIFVYGAFLGFFISLILGKRDTTIDHVRYMSIYSSQSYGLIGLCFIFCAMPFLCVGGLYRTSTNDSAILWIAPLNMWFSLIAGVLGSFCASALSYRKVFLHDLVFSGISVTYHYNLGWNSIQFIIWSSSQSCCTFNSWLCNWTLIVIVQFCCFKNHEFWWNCCKFKHCSPFHFPRNCLFYHIGYIAWFWTNSDWYSLCLSSWIKPWKNQLNSGSLSVDRVLLECRNRNVWSCNNWSFI